ncbi:unnamed protein product [Amoebophrya sp. A120]|nr:unnamed protein product [Amoebophrya sp. A120]|eukprot:GSA120T00004370001.1
MPRVPREKNPLLQKDEIGRAKFSAYDLPPDTHSFGNVMGCDMEGAGEVLRTWANHQKSVPKAGNKVNYIAYNKKKCNLLVRPDSEQTAPGRTPGKRVPATSSSKPAPKPVGDFGKPTRSSTPIGRVIGNLYAVEYEQMREEMQHAEETAAKPKKTIYQTKASLGHKKAAEKRLKVEEEHKPFMMKKFLNVQASFKLPGPPPKKGHGATQIPDIHQEELPAAPVKMCLWPLICLLEGDARLCVSLPMGMRA